MRWFIKKSHLVWLIAVLTAVIVAMAFASCIPVTVRPEFDEAGLPVALPVTPTGSISPDGTLVPVYPVSTTAPTAFDWGTVGAIAGAITSALLAVYGINLRGALSKGTAALKIACDLADRNAEAETDEQVKINKSAAASLQLAAGVHDLTQKVRGK